jgi:hypothetical protein
MAQKTFVDGDVLTASDINTYLMGEGGAWTSHTPQIDQGASVNISKTVNYCKYARHGRMITWTFHMSIVSSGSAGLPVTVTLPVTASSSFAVWGSGFVYDASTLTIYNATVGGTSSTASFVVDGAGSGSSWGLFPNLALANGDTIAGSVTYEAAT